MEEKELREKIFTALGEASMCWNPAPTGVFDSTRAKRIGDELIDSLKSNGGGAAVLFSTTIYLKQKKQRRT